MAGAHVGKPEQMQVGHRHLIYDRTIDFADNAVIRHCHGIGWLGMVNQVSDAGRSLLQIGSGEQTS